MTIISTRGSAPPLRFDDAPPDAVDFLAIGGGFAGLMTALHVRAGAPAARIAIVERTPRPAPGVAYGACHLAHLLNVPADRMGADPSDPGGFLRWLRGRAGGVVEGGDFVPRARFGEYLNDLFAAAFDADTARRPRLVRNEVVALASLPDGRLSALLASGERIAARTVLLAVGLPASEPPWEGRCAGVPASALVADPWSPGALAAPRDARVLVIGSGLTAIDAILSLRRAGHRGRIVVVSRHGRFPCPHPPPGAAPFAYDRSLAGSPLPVLLRTVRRAIRDRAAAGAGWHAAIDALRPQAAAIWQGLSERDRGRFLARLRPHWEVHRHRAPGEVLAEMDSLRREGSLDLLAGELLEATVSRGGALIATIARRGSPEGPIRSLEVDRLVNCCGPSMDLARTRDPLLRSLLDGGIARTDPHGLGLRTDPSARLLPAEGAAAAPPVHVIGALRRGDLWESTAIPELRAQALAVASEVIATLRADPVLALSARAVEDVGARGAAGANGSSSPAGAPAPLPRRDATANPPSALAPLLGELARVAAPIPYERLVTLLGDHPVTAEQLGDTIQIDGAAYVRTLVFASPHVEVLVMAWLPGQFSPIHDHAGSGCAVRVVAGCARERLYRRQADGSVTAAGERLVRTGDIAGAYDEEIHAFGNAADAPAPPDRILVTLHVYSPPLRPTRKYQVRPVEQTV